MAGIDESFDVMLNLPHVTEIEADAIEFVVPVDSPKRFETRRLYRKRVGHLIPGQSPVDIAFFGPEFFWIEGWSEEDPYED